MRSVRSPRGSRSTSGRPDGGNGHTAYDLDSFAAFVREVPPESIRYHQSRGDFARWLREAVGDGEVAARVEGLDDPARIAAHLDEAVRSYGIA